MNFDDLGDTFADSPLPTSSRKRAEISREAFLALPARHVPCGYFTLTLTDGSQKRFRIRVERGNFMTGCRTLSRYCKIEADDDVEREWETIASVAADGFKLFKRWRGEWEEKWAIALWFLLNDMPDRALGYLVKVEPRCWMTMRELKDDDGKRTGLCKAQRKRLGIA